MLLINNNTLEGINGHDQQNDVTLKLFVESHNSLAHQSGVLNQYFLEQYIGYKMKNNVRGDVINLDNMPTLKTSYIIVTYIGTC